MPLVFRFLATFPESTENARYALTDALIMLSGHHTTEVEFGAALSATMAPLDTAALKQSERAMRLVSRTEILRFASAQAAIAQPAERRRACEYDTASFVAERSAGAPTYLASLAAQAIATIRPMLDQRRQSLYATLPSQHRQLHCGQDAVAHIISAVLAHCSRYAPEHAALALELTLDQHALRLEVCDDGWRVDSRQLPRLFDLFAADDIRGASSERIEPDVGELALARELVVRRGGSFTLTCSETTRGQRAVVTLPNDPDDPARIDTDNTADGSHSPAGAPQMKRRVLVIEDSADTALALSAALGQQGYAVITAPDGLSGVRCAKEYLPDAVIIDIGLPDIDGFEVARLLRADPALEGVLLIASSGYGLRPFRPLADHWVFNHYLLKPTSVVALHALISTSLDAGKGGEEG